MPPTDERQLLGPVLRDVSRSFYKTLQLLPARVRKPISLAYLLARTTDTIADTELIPASERLEALKMLRTHVKGSQLEALSFSILAAKQASAAEKLLLERVNDIVALLETLSATDRDLVRKVLDTITSGQELISNASAWRPRKIPQRCNRPRNWMITPSAWLVAWVSFGRVSAWHIFFPRRL